MSSSKMIVQKLEDNNIKFLNVIINDVDNKTCQTNFSKWTNSKIQQKNKNAEKARLVVKIVSGEEFKFINLDFCAREVDNRDIYLNNIAHFPTVTNSTASNFYTENSSQDNFLRGVENIQDNYYYNQFDYRNYKAGDGEINKGILLEKNMENKVSLQNFNIYYNDTEKFCSNSGQLLSPLEQSLERVKENNARIMENIHMLNRTLDYTKKKEILDIVGPKSMRSFPCNVCGKCFVYATGLKRHYSMRHAIAEQQPRWQVVWTCIQCFQVWPRQDLAIKHSNICHNSDNTDCVREIKTSLLLQCEFCEKVFTSIPRLIRHSKIHNTVNNYECNACGLAFLSYKTTEQHWLLCPWLKMCYSFSLQKMLLCNACDRKFRNYEQLYNHRYKVGHFMVKTHFNQGSAKSLGILVYQCETCAQWYTSSSLLRAHKSQYHPQYDNGTCRIDKNNEDNHDNYYISANDEYYCNKIDNNVMHNH